MTDRTATWKERADRLRISTPIIAKATGRSISAVEKYRYGNRNPNPAWLARVDRLLTDIERAISGGDAA